MWTTSRLSSTLRSGLVLCFALAGLAACGRNEFEDVAQPMDAASQRLLFMANEALQQHNFELALAYVDTLAARAPELADVPFMRGRIYAELVRLDEAEASYREALEIRPNYPGGWHNLGNTAFRQQKYTQAIRFYEREIKAHPDPRPWRGIAQAYVELGKVDSAQYAFEQAIRVDSTFAPAHFGLALLFEDLGDFPKALHASRRALAHAPDNPEYHYHVGSNLFKLNRAQEAVPHLEAVIEQWPWHHSAHYNMAQALMRMGRTDEAQVFQVKAEKLRDLQATIAHHENTARVQPKDPMAHAGLGSLLRRAGRYNDAMHAYMVALHLDPGNLEFRNNVAVLHLLRKDTTAAIHTFEQIVRADPTYVHAWMNLGSLYAMSGHLDQAQHAWQTALRLDPSNDVSRRSLAMLKPVSHP